MKVSVRHNLEGAPNRKTKSTQDKKTCEVVVSVSKHSGRRRQEDTKFKLSLDKLRDLARPCLKRKYKKYKKGRGV